MFKFSQLDDNKENLDRAIYFKFKKRVEHKGVQQEIRAGFSAIIKCFIETYIRILTPLTITFEKMFKWNITSKNP